MSSVKEVIIPEENKKDLAEIPDNILRKLTIHPVKNIEQVLEIALQRSPLVDLSLSTLVETEHNESMKKNVNKDLHAQ